MGTCVTRDAIVCLDRTLDAHNCLLPTSPLNATYSWREGDTGDYENTGAANAFGSSARG